MNFQCQDCHHIGRLDCHGRCELCTSDAVAAVEILTEEVEVP